MSGGRLLLGRSAMRLRYHAKIQVAGLPFKSRCALLRLAASSPDCLNLSPLKLNAFAHLFAVARHRQSLMLLARSLSHAHVVLSQTCPERHNTVQPQRGEHCFLKQVNSTNLSENEPNSAPTTPELHVVQNLICSSRCTS